MIIGIVGLMGVGKNTVAQYIVDKYGFQQDSFAKPLKDCLSAVFGWDRNMLEGVTEEDRKQREIVDIWWAEKLGIPDLSPRWAMQHWGTDLVRKRFHTDLWARSLENRLMKNIDKNVIISDCRFPNELESITNLNGVVINVTKGTPEWMEYAIIYNKGPERNPRWYTAKEKLDKFKIHESEIALSGVKADYIIENTGTLEELYHRVDSIMIDLGFGK